MLGIPCSDVECMFEITILYSHQSSQEEVGGCFTKVNNLSRDSTNMR